MTLRLIFFFCQSSLSKDGDSFDPDFQVSFIRIVHEDFQTSSRYCSVGQKEGEERCWKCLS